MQHEFHVSPVMPSILAGDPERLQNVERTIDRAPQTVNDHQE
jgi:hypothetical protein